MQKWVGLMVGLTFLYFGCANADTVNNVKNNPDSSLIKNGKLAFEKGKITYNNFCSNCHGKLYSHIDGPNIFDNLFERLPNPPDQYFLDFVKNSDSLKMAEDKYYQLLKEKYNISITHIYKDKINDEEMQNLLTFMLIANRMKHKGQLP